MRLVPDTSAIINGVLGDKIERGEWKDVSIIIHRAVVAELEYQANLGRETGFVGLEELQRLQKLSRSHGIELVFEGEEPRFDQIHMFRNIYVDAQVRKLAEEKNAFLVTSDRVQAETARATGVSVIYIPPSEVEEPEVFTFFEEDVMSVHLKEDVPPMRKRGKPGRIKLEVFGEEPLKRKQLKEWAKQIVEFAKRDPRGYIEREWEGATVVQYRDYRIAITYPPFSERWEITIVRPVAKVTLDDYRLSDKLKKRLRERAEGILIAGPPGAGKSTFAQALAEFYLSLGKIVKTMESPRDLQLPPQVTQYAPLEGDMEKTADILLLVRPDYTIYDEIRKMKDFDIFTDMRLAGVGMVGVIHASRAIEAVQRFARRIELGIIPQVIDTVIFIKDGRVQKVYSLDLVVRVPTGMRDEDLARPVVEVRDFESGKLEYEIYTFGEETVVVPVKEESQPLDRYAGKSIAIELRRYIDVPFRVEVRGGKVILYVPEQEVPHVIGKGGKRIAEIEERIGVPIEVKGEKTNITIKKKRIVIDAGEPGEYEVLVEGKVVYRGKTDKRGKIRINRSTVAGEIIERAVLENKPVEVRRV